MVTRSTNKLFHGKAIVLADPVNTIPVSELGYTSQGSNVTVNGDIETVDERVDELDGKVGKHVVSRSFGISMTQAQIEPEIMAMALGLDANGNEIVVGGASGELPEFAARVVGTKKDKSPIHIIMDKAVCGSNLTLEAGKSQSLSLPLEFDAIASGPTTGMARILVGRTVQAATLATGAFARTQAASTVNGIAWAKITGETPATGDDLDDITAGVGSAALTDGEIIRLQIASTTMPITVQHATGIIELKGEADFVMTKLADWIDLYYDLANTTWKEITRYDAP